MAAVDMESEDAAGEYEDIEEDEDGDLSLLKLKASVAPCRQMDFFANDSFFCHSAMQ